MIGLKMKRSELERLVSAGRRMYEGGLVAGALGSMGVRLASGEVAVTAQGSRLGFLDGGDILPTNGKGLPPEGQRGVPDRDAGMLAAVLSAQPEAGSVIKVHSPYATALAHMGRKKLENSQHLMEHLGGVAFVPYYRPGTAGLAGAVAEAMRRNRVAVVEGQGPVVRGTDIDDAVDRAEALEAAAKVIFLLSGDNGV